MIMQTPLQGRYISAFGWSAALVSVLSALLVVLKEKNEGVLTWMKAATGHHWITHGVIVVAAFAVIGFALSMLSRPTPLNRIVAAILAATVVSGLILVGFFVLE